MRLLSLIFLFPLLATAQESFDILIKNGKIIDGSGNNWYYSDLAIKNGKIIQIARDIKPGTAKKIIDAKGMIVAPGFIDVHTHLEEDEAKDPETKSFIYDGVTTCIQINTCRNC